jgi:hypothetical protein
MFSEKLTRPSRQWLLVALTVGLALAVALSMVFADDAEAKKKHKKKLRAFNVSSTVPESNFGGAGLATLGPSNPLTGATTPYTYGGTNKFVRLNVIQVTLTCNACDTENAASFDFNNLTLGLDGIDTGLKLNGLDDSNLDTITVAGVPNNAAQILAALKADGQLVGTVLDATAAPTNNAAFPATSNTTLQLFGLKRR